MGGIDCLQGCLRQTPENLCWQKLHNRDDAHRRRYECLRVLDGVDYEWAGVRAAAPRGIATTVKAYCIDTHL